MRGTARRAGRLRARICHIIAAWPRSGRPAMPPAARRAAQPRDR
ncbi:hypothetical protein BURMUCGD1_3735 [Burkholderia multivorans CGD1]|nr:hypothetical protein BURMUCGD1_3735 [Burkholderia multivorans CGD1]